MSDHTARLTPAICAPLEQPHVLWVTGYPGSGKTWIGDYLESLAGFSHVEGDAMLSSQDPTDKEIADKLKTAFYVYWMRGFPAPDHLWHPYYTVLCNDIMSASAANPTQGIVCTFSTYPRAVRDFIRTRIPNVHFVLLDLDNAPLLERLVGRYVHAAKAFGQDIDTFMRTSVHKQARETNPALNAALTAEPFVWQDACRLYMGPWLDGLEPRGHPVVSPSDDSAPGPDAKRPAAADPSAFDDEPATFTLDVSDNARGGDLCGVARALHALCGLGPVVAMQTETDAGGNRVLVAPLVPACGADADEATRVAACRAMCEAVSRRNYARWEEKAAKGERWGE